MQNRVSRLFTFVPSGRSFASRLVALGLLSLLAGGCDRNIEPFEPGEEPSPPDLARIFPAQPSGVGGAEGTSAANSQDGRAARGAMPPTRAEAGAPAAAAATASAAPIAGVIEIAPDLVGDQPGDAVLFVIARPQGARGGPPLAVLRVASPSFPLDFEIGPENVMIPSMQFVGPISLSARLDTDGNAMTRGGEDLSSATLEPLEPGATGVQVVLSEKGS